VLPMLPCPHNVGAAAVGALLLAGLNVAAAPAGDSGREPKIMALRALADAHVNAATRSANYGRAPRLRVDASPLVRTYLRFHIGRYQGDVQRVNLLLYSRTQSAIGFRVRSVTRRWRERRITFANAPRLVPPAVPSGRLRAGRWTAVDVTALVDGVEEAEVGFALSTSARRAIELASRESGTTGPRLVLEIDSSGEGP
jgi:acid phosphatase type 7